MNYLFKCDNNENNNHLKTNEEFLIPYDLPPLKYEITGIMNIIFIKSRFFINNYVYVLNFIFNR